MERFDMSFKNPIVRVWFYIILPTILISMILFLILPMEFHNAVSIIGSLIFIGYLIWTFVHKKKIR